jgi:hypothetical protein
MIIEVEDESGSVRNGSLTMDAERIRLHSKAAGSILIRNLFFLPWLFTRYLYILRHPSTVLRTLIDTVSANNILATMISVVERSSSPTVLITSCLIVEQGPRFIWYRRSIAFIASPVFLSRYDREIINSRYSLCAQGPH